MGRMDTIHFMEESDGDRRTDKGRTDFASVYKEYYPKVYGYVYRILLHQQNAEDIVSETFYKALLSFDSYDESKGTLSAWLCRIAHHCAVNFLLSKTYRSGISMEALMEEGRMPEEARNDWQDGTAEWEAWEILRRLSVKEREMLNYRYLLGMSNKEIAQELNIGEKAVSERYRRLLAKCRKIADNWENGS